MPQSSKTMTVPTPPATHWSAGVRSLPVEEWPAADREAWEIACRPGERLKRGGAASHMKSITRNDLARRYGYFLDYVGRSGETLDANADAALYATPERVENYVAELKGRVSSVTVYGSIYKLRRIAQLLAPNRDFVWLTELEKDLELVMQPKSKFGRFVYTDVLVEAGITLMAEADAATHRSDLWRARQFRDGLMVALLAVCPVRLKNFAALEIGSTLVQADGSWWIVLAASQTKEGRPDERPVPAFLTLPIDRYLATHRPVLAHGKDERGALWLSSNDGRALTYPAAAKAITQTTLASIGMSISPHLFRTAAASTAAQYAGRTPHLASALLHHTDSTVTEQHYNRASSIKAAQSYADVVRGFRSDG